MASFVFGTASLGLPYGLGRGGAPPSLMSEEHAASLVEAALAHGIKVFDTAPAYGVAEERLGRTLGERGEVWTKLGRNERVGDRLLDDVVASVEASIARLGRPRIELLQWHNWTANLSDDVHFCRAWDALAQDSRIAGLGASTYGVDDALAAVKSGLFATVQVEWNILNPWVVDAIAPLARTNGVAIAVRSVFLQGALTDDARDLPDLPVLRDRVAAAAECAKRYGLSLRDLALRSALGHADISYVLMGLERLEQVDDAVRIAGQESLDGSVARSCRNLARNYDDALDPRLWHASKR